MPKKNRTSRKETSQQPKSPILHPNQRTKGWVKYNDEIVFILKTDGMTHVRKGHICSSPGSHGGGNEIDNILKTIVWSDAPLRDAGSADDAHETGFDINDPLLLRADEADLLKNAKTALLWFKGILSRRQILRIVKFLSMPDFGLAFEHTEKAAYRRTRRLNKIRLVS